MAPARPAAQRQRALPVGQPAPLDGARGGDAYGVAAAALDRPIRAAAAEAAPCGPRSALGAPPRVCITAGCSWAGLRLAHALRARGAREVLLFDQRPPLAALEPGLVWCQGREVQEPERLSEALALHGPVDAVVHLGPCAAGCAGDLLAGAAERWRAVEGTRNVAAACAQNGVQRLVLTLWADRGRQAVAANAEAAARSGAAAGPAGGGGGGGGGCGVSAVWLGGSGGAGVCGAAKGDQAPPASQGPEPGLPYGLVKPEDWQPFAFQAPFAAAGAARGANGGGRGPRCEGAKEEAIAALLSDVCRVLCA
ncbi:MAG: hypothetical protein J3K34DRAFT_219274 [Monoraphidium minutum]|nr:MAG: hypothetical protein J3K34DRAFT_219274 [Monoraphidium minutum]